MPSQLSPPKRRAGLKARPPGSGGQLFSGVPRRASSQAQRLSYSSRLSPALGSSTDSMRSLTQQLRGSNMDLGSTPSQPQPRFLPPPPNHTPSQTSTEKPELTYILLGEGSTGTRGCEPTLAWEKGLERKPTAFKTGTKVQQKHPKPFETNRSKRGLQSVQLPVTAGHPSNNTPTTTQQQSGRSGPRSPLVKHGIRGHHREFQLLGSNIILRTFGKEES